MIVVDRSDRRRRRPSRAQLIARAARRRSSSRTKRSSCRLDWRVADTRLPARATAGRRAAVAGDGRRAFRRRLVARSRREDCADAAISNVAASGAEAWTRADAVERGGRRGRAREPHARELEELTGRRHDDLGASRRVRRKSLGLAHAGRSSAAFEAHEVLHYGRTSRKVIEQRPCARFLDVIVIGAGHAGCEAAWAAARLGCRVGLCTLSPRPSRICRAIPRSAAPPKATSFGKIDALGGLMGARDRRDGHPVQDAQSQPRSGRLVAARAGRQAALRRLDARSARREPNITWIPRRAGRIVRRRRARWAGVRGRRRARVRAPRRHDRHVPERARSRRRRAAPAGRARRAADARAGRLARAFGFDMGRLKTGTPPRLDRRTIDFAAFPRPNTATIRSSRSRS